MEPLKQFARIKKIPYATATIQDKMVMVYRKINGWHEETGEWVWKEALDFFITTPLKHELSLKYFEYAILKYAHDSSVTDSYRADVVLSLADNYGKINNPILVAKEIYGDRYPAIEKALINNMVDIFKTGLANQLIDKEVFKKQIIKEHKYLGIKPQLTHAFSSI